jgi:hypothetical protein
MTDYDTNLPFRTKRQIEENIEWLFKEEVYENKKDRKL